MLQLIQSYQAPLLWLGAASVVLFLGSVVVIPLIIAYLPDDYFIRVSKALRKLSLPHLIGRCIKNLIGVVFLFAGFVMLFIPGQGILTSLLGLSLIDFPGKRRLEIRLIKKPRVQKMIMWCRRKAGRKPFIIPDN